MAGASQASHAADTQVLHTVMAELQAAVNDATAKAAAATTAHEAAEMALKNERLQAPTAIEPP